MCWPPTIAVCKPLKSIPPRPDSARCRSCPAAWLAVILLCLSSGAFAQEVWLATYGPGDEVWERFGHNGLWLRDEGRGIDRVYSFGYFDMNRSGFYTDYAYGRMVYEAMVVPSDREFAWYRSRGRSIRLQRLDLDAAGFDTLHRRLEAAVGPESSGYAYDYYLNNCSTRIRDLLDEVTGGALRERFVDRPAMQNFREHTRRLTQQRLWLHTGIMAGLGAFVDRPRNAWEEMFLPAAMADWLPELTVGGEPLVIFDRVVHDPEVFQPPDQSSIRWMPYAGFGLITVLVIALAHRMAPLSVWGRLPADLWMLATTLVGAALIFLWGFTAHAAAAGNWLVLLLNPVWLLLLLPLPDGIRRGLVILLAAATVIGTAILAWPGGWQYRPGLLLWIVPAHGVALWSQWVVSRARDGRSAG